jgi:hypothetical protein
MVYRWALRCTRITRRWRTSSVWRVAAHLLFFSFGKILWIKSLLFFSLRIWCQKVHFLAIFARKSIIWSLNPFDFIELSAEHLMSWCLIPLFSNFISNEIQIFLFFILSRPHNPSRCHRRHTVWGSIVFLNRCGICFFHIWLFEVSIVFEILMSF